MKLKDIAVTTKATQETQTIERPPVRLQSANPEVQELLDRWYADEEMDCPLLNDSDLAFISAVFNEVLDNPEWAPTLHIFGLIGNLNGRLASWAKRK